MILTQASTARNALWLMLFVMGVVSMAWVPRFPEIKTANALTMGSRCVWNLKIWLRNHGVNRLRTQHMLYSHDTCTNNAGLFPGLALNY